MIFDGVKMNKTWPDRHKTLKLNADLPSIENAVAYTISIVNY